MIKALGITSGLCGLTVLAATSLSIAQDQAALRVAASPNGTPAVFVLDRGMALGQLTAPVAASLQAASGPTVVAASAPSGETRPVARPGRDSGPDIGKATFTAAVEPVFTQQVTRNAFDYQTQLSATAYNKTRAPDPKKLKGRVLIGVYR